MRVLAIDPGFERLGIAILEKERHGKEKLLFSSCFHTDAALPFPERLSRIGDEVERVIKRYGPRTCAIETLFFSSNQKTALRVAETRGAIIFISQKNGLAIFEYSPTQVKIATTSDGGATKKQIAAMIPRLVNLPEKMTRNDDELDAIAIGLTFFAHAKF